ncbi:type II toxin-antitoxin system YafQ family toxin [Helicobacter trogontum]|uniref:Type II toxin-antitoxin system mRNA interferase toxin, RelE/StbE family n=1 Tax=Helicobacter trogontum TaxID=50960 RepID=A0A099VCH2_9HELI|nr:type II toxin-antitoxin system mRNA interferase toxin, RelE/StbE family [Helicobacter trogontum]TLD84663.1 type II toxin-antitoxin system mRNA interferase toxin, RelE/StbE family [Helicobacter trogontum]
MLKLKIENSFKKDIKTVYKQGLKQGEIEPIIQKLLSQELLESKYKDHKLQGDLKDFRECHIKPDLLLIYQVKQDSLHLVRIGSHNHLFK